MNLTFRTHRGDVSVTHFAVNKLPNIYFSQFCWFMFVNIYKVKIKVVYKKSMFTEKNKNKKEQTIYFNLFIINYTVIYM